VTDSSVIVLDGLDRPGDGPSGPSGAAAPVVLYDWLALAAGTVATHLAGAREALADARAERDLQNERIRALVDIVERLERMERAGRPVRHRA
jgi:hypothetical protein